MSTTNRFWIPHPTEVWVPAWISAQDSDKVEFTCEATPNLCYYDDSTFGTSSSSSASGVQALTDGNDNTAQLNKSMAMLHKNFAEQKRQKTNNLIRRKSSRFGVTIGGEKDASHANSSNKKEDWGPLLPWCHEIAFGKDPGAAALNQIAAFTPEKDGKDGNSTNDPQTVPSSIKRKTLTGQAALDMANTPGNSKDNDSKADEPKVFKGRPGTVTCANKNTVITFWTHDAEKLLNRLNPVNFPDMSDDYMAQYYYQEIQDITHLESVSEAILLETIRSRFWQHEIYTNVSKILISVNPFKLLPIYGARYLQRYSVKERGKKEKKLQYAYSQSYSMFGDTSNFDALQDELSLSPHIYGLAGEAFKQLSETREPQAILISGESGAGKTEAAKLVLSYVTSEAESLEGLMADRNRATVEGGGSDSYYKESVLLMNPILETFGNARTIRNNNSSRFGKWIELVFDRSLRICGAQISEYLLEKTRVVDVSVRERNYHSFYQCLRFPEIYNLGVLYDSSTNELVCESAEDKKQDLVTRLRLMKAKMKDTSDNNAIEFENLSRKDSKETEPQSPTAHGTCSQPGSPTSAAKKTPNTLISKSSKEQNVNIWHEVTQHKCYAEVKGSNRLVGSEGDGYFSPILRYEMDLSKSKKRFSYLYMGDAYSPNVDDQEDHIECVKSLLALNFQEKEIVDLFTVLSGLLHLGNCHFETSDAGDDGSKLSTNSYVHLTQVLKCLFGRYKDEDWEPFVACLNEKTFVIRNETSKKKLNPTLAKHQRDTVAMFLYDKIFTWLIHRMNKVLLDERLFGIISAGCRYCILDIFGFEIFQTNSLEQLFINWSNECLQQFFNHSVFQVEIEELQAEVADSETFSDIGLSLIISKGKPDMSEEMQAAFRRRIEHADNPDKRKKSVFSLLDTDSKGSGGQKDILATLFNFDFVDNANIMKLIQGKPGILQLLNDEVALPTASELHYVSEMNKAFYIEEEKKKSAHNKAIKNENSGIDGDRTPNSKNDEESKLANMSAKEKEFYKIKKHYIPSKFTNSGLFKVQHFAGAVEYDTNNWVDKNTIKLPDLTYLLEHTENAVVKSAMRMISRDGGASLQATKKDNEPEVGKAQKKANATVASEFQRSLDSLMKKVSSAHSHFIRCIKPNDEKAPDLFTSNMVQEQLLLSGVLDAVKIRQSGFALRLLFADFVFRYQVLYGWQLRKSLRREFGRIEWKSDPLAIVTLVGMLPDLAKIKKEDILVGVKKVFIRDGASNKMEKIRNREIRKIAVKICALARGYQVRKLWNLQYQYINYCKTDLLVKWMGRKDQHFELSDEFINSLKDMQMNFLGNLPVFEKAKLAIAGFEREWEVQSDLWDYGLKYLRFGKEDEVSPTSAGNADFQGSDVIGLEKFISKSKHVIRRIGKATACLGLTDEDYVGMLKEKKERGQKDSSMGIKSAQPGSVAGDENDKDSSKGKYQKLAKDLEARIDDAKLSDICMPITYAMVEDLETKLKSMRAEIPLLKAILKLKIIITSDKPFEPEQQMPEVQSLIKKIEDAKLDVPEHWTWEGYHAGGHGLYTTLKKKYILQLKRGSKSGQDAEQAIEAAKAYVFEEMSSSIKERIFGQLERAIPLLDASEIQSCLRELAEYPQEQDAEIVQKGRELLWNLDRNDYLLNLFKETLTETPAKMAVNASARENLINRKLKNLSDHLKSANLLEEARTILKFLHARNPEGVLDFDVDKELSKAGRNANLNELDKNLNANEMKKNASFNAANNKAFQKKSGETALSKTILKRTDPQKLEKLRRIIARGKLDEADKTWRDRFSEKPAGIDEVFSAENIAKIVKKRKRFDELSHVYLKNGSQITVCQINRG